MEVSPILSAFCPTSINALKPQTMLTSFAYNGQLSASDIILA